MPKFKGTVCRISYGFHEIEVEADNEEQAIEKMIDEAGNYEFSEKSSDYSLDGGVQRELSKQSLNFSYQGKNFNFEFTPEEEEDWWTSFNQNGYEFDVHYLEDEDNEICVYLVVDGKSQTQETIHKQKIVL